jgi:hypothetical protein
VALAALVLAGAAATAAEAKPGRAAGRCPPAAAEPQAQLEGRPCAEQASVAPSRSGRSAPGGQAQRPPPARAAQAAGEGAEDPLQSLGGDSPFCRRAPGGRGGRNCRSSGALAHPYPIGNYGFDIHIDTGVTRIESNLLMAVQTLALLCWLGLLYLVKGVLLGLEWAFSLDLLGASLAHARRTLMRLHTGLLGEPWLLLAIAVAGLWGIWRGLVQRQTIQTISGLGATVALMVAALVLIQSPLQTVGQASKLTNDASLGLLAGASTGATTDGRRALGDATSGVFDSLVLHPWCALQFGDIEFCLSRPPADIPADLADEADQPRTVADLWLRHPAGGEERERLYEQWRGDGHPLQPKVRLQKQGQTATRLALLALIAVGLVGALCLLGWIALKLLAQAVLALLLLLCAPAMLLAPAFGDAGRGVFLGWAKRLAAAIVAKAIYALLLALVLVTAGLLAQFESLGFMGLWLLQCTLWWGLFLQRRQLTGFLTAAQQTSERHRGLVRQAHSAAAGWALAKQPAGAVAIAAAAPVRGLRRSQRDRAERHHVERQAAARQGLDQRADQAHQARLQAARQTLERDHELATDLQRTDRLLARHDQRAQLAKAKRAAPPRPSSDERALLAHREALRRRREPPERIRQARLLAEAADRNLALDGHALTPVERDRLVQQRRDDLKAGLPADHERSLAWAGIDPASHYGADPAQQARHEQQAERAAERDRQLIAALPGPTVPVGLAEERQRQRRARQRRQHLYRRR